jgi:hypothetical protein
MTAKSLSNNAINIALHKKANALHFKLLNSFKNASLEVDAIHKEKQAKNGLKTVIQVEKYASEKIEEIQSYLALQKHCILKGATGIGKTTLLTKLQKSRKIRVVALPRIANVLQLQKSEGFTGYDAIHSDLNNLNRIYESQDIVCCHKGLLKILKDLKHNDIEVIIDEFHALLQNIDANELDELKDVLKELKVIYISATIDLNFGYFFTNKMIEVIQSKPHKHNITILHNKEIDNKKKGRHKELVIDIELKKAIENNQTLLVHIESKATIQKYVSKYQNNYKVACLNVDTENKNELINELGSSKIPYDIVFFTSTVEAGININAIDCRLLLTDTFIPYSKVNGNKNILNPLRITQLIGRLRKAKDVCIYIDFDKVNRKKELSYIDFKKRLNLDDYDLNEIERQNHELYDNISCHSDSYIDFDKNDNAYFSESKILQRFLDDKYNHFSVNDLAKYLDAEIIDYVEELPKEPQKPKETTLKRKDFEQLLNNEIVENHNKVLSFAYEIGALKISDNTFYQYIETDTTDLIHLEDDFCKYDSSVKDIVRRYFLFLTKESDPTILKNLLNTEKKYLPLIENRINQETKNVSFRNPGTIECKKTKQEAEKFKKLAQTIKYKTSKENLLREKAEKEAFKIFNKYIPYNDIIKILNIYYNVEFSSKCIMTLSKINSRNKYYINSSNVPLKIEKPMVHIKYKKPIENPLSLFE